jgi:hypothetical protein
MKASVITLHTVDNYGSVMQTYATQQILKKCGYDVEFVDYWRRDNLPQSRAERMLEGSTLQKLKPLWGINNFTRKATVSILKSVLEKQRSPMWRFLEEKVQLTKVRYYSYEELEANPPVADVYITGSDQVWNSIWNQGIDRSYFLNFAPAGKPRIAFSASIGREQLDTEEIPETKRLLEKYSAISVREQSAVELLASMDIESTLVLDPTLMLEAEEWRKLATKQKREKPYILIYQLNPNPQMDQYAGQLAQKRGWDVIRIGFGRSDRRKGGKSVMLPSVEEFLGLFCDAACVLTDSFHATAFSLNLGSDFISVLPGRFGTRIESILKLTGTENRLLTRYDNFEIVDKVIDKKWVKEMLEKKRTEDIQWLMQALNV